MSNKSENAAERLARLKREREEASKNGQPSEIVNQLTHESAGEPDFSALAEKLKKRHEEEKVSALDGTVKYTIYVDTDIAEAFNALCLKRGDQRKYINQALSDFVLKKSKELGI